MSIACTELVAVADEGPEPGCLWGQEAEAHMSLSSQMDPGLEMSRTEPQRNFRQLIPRQDSQSKPALPSITQQSAPPSASPHRPGPTRMSPVGPGLPSEPGEDTGASRDCLLWQSTWPSEAASWVATPPAHTCGVPWRVPLACQRGGGLEGDRRWGAVLREVSELPPKVSGQQPCKLRPPVFCLWEGGASSPREEAISRPSAPRASLLPRRWPGP